MLVPFYYNTLLHTVFRAQALICSMPRRIQIQHLHLAGLTHYEHASALQATVVSRFLAFKRNPSSLPLPPPTIITFSPYPIYTTGRRDSEMPSSAQLRVLRAPLPPDSRTAGARPQTLQTADFAHALRGGRTTFHGPGQLVIYPIFSLAHPPSFARGVLSSRCYVDTLEEATIRTVAPYGVRGVRASNPGVWVVGPSPALPNGDGGNGTKSHSDERKIAALGVHLRRNVASHGVALNITTDLRWFDRIVACGLEGKSVTSLEHELASAAPPTLEEVAESWVANFARLVGFGRADGRDVDGGETVRVSEEDITGTETRDQSGQARTWDEAHLVLGPTGSQATTG